MIDTQYYRELTLVIFIIVLQGVRNVSDDHKLHQILQRNIPLILYHINFYILSRSLP